MCFFPAYSSSQLIQDAHKMTREWLHYAWTLHPSISLLAFCEELAHPSSLSSHVNLSICDTCPSAQASIVYVGLDKPPLPKVVVRYGSDATDAFIELADAIEDAFPDLAVDGTECEELGSDSPMTLTDAEGRQLAVLDANDAEAQLQQVLQALQEAGHNPAA